MSDNGKQTADQDMVELLTAGLASALDTLQDVLNQACYYQPPDGADPYVDSMAITAYADGLRLMAAYERFTIEHQYGRRVVGRWRNAD